MSLFDNVLINTLYVLMPFAIYLFYIAYKKIDDQRENELAVVVTIFSAIYICLKYSVSMTNQLPLVIVNVPLIVAYYKKNTLSIIASSIIIMIYSYIFYHLFLLFFILEYILYYIIYNFLKNKKNSFNLFIIIFSIIKTTFMFLITYINDSYNFDIFWESLLSGIILLFTSLITVYLLKKGENLMQIHMLVKEVEKDKQIRTALFQITHEIKNPIAVCKGYLDMFDINNNRHAREYIPIMKEEINRTLTLLEDFLSINKIKLNKDILDINYLLEETINEFKIFFREHHIKTKINLSDTEIYINGDYNRLRQVFLNIIKNSIEAFKNDPLLEVWSEEKQNKVYICFKDNGTGISKEVLEKIKEPFFTTKQKGTGLGVPLSCEIIRGHDGEVIYDSKEGQYTLVTIILPILNN